VTSTHAGSIIVIAVVAKPAVTAPFTMVLDG
jgi:hypothetical protein